MRGLIRTLKMPLCETIVLIVEEHQLEASGNNIRDLGNHF